MKLIVLAGSTTMRLVRDTPGRRLAFISLPPTAAGLWSEPAAAFLDWPMEPRFLPYSGTAVFDFVQTGRCRAHSSHTPRYPLCTRGSARFFHELRAWPAEFDLSQSRAAQIFDVSMRTIQEWEQERAAPAQDALHGDMGPNGARPRSISSARGWSRSWSPPTSPRAGSISSLALQ